MSQLVSKDIVKCGSAIKNNLVPFTSNHALINPSGLSLAKSINIDLQ